MNICKVSGCDREVKSVDMCRKHYLRFRKYGDAEYLRTDREGAEIRFWNSIDKNGPWVEKLQSNCWVWSKGMTNTGYGSFWWEGEQRKTHTIAFYLTYGKWAEPYCSHRCDNLLCCNPEHLYESDNGNIADSNSLEGWLLRPTTQKNFWAKVAEPNFNGCRLWLGTCNSKTGYPIFYHHHRPLRGNRIAFYLAKGYWPNICRHTCDVKLCVEPSHLIDGTHQDNVRDRVERDRTAKGENNGNAVLTREVVEQIRADYVPRLFSYEKVAAKYGISVSTVRQIIWYVTWKN